MSDIERERHDYNVSQFSMKRANYGLTDEITKRCNVCVSGQIVLGTGIRLCEVHKSFITCGGTCHLHELDKKYYSLKKGTESEEEKEKTNYVSERPCIKCKDYKTDTRNEPCKTCLLDSKRSKWKSEKDEEP